MYHVGPRGEGGARGLQSAKTHDPSQGLCLSLFRVELDNEDMVLATEHGQEKYLSQVSLKLILVPLVLRRLQDILSTLLQQKQKQSFLEIGPKPRSSTIYNTKSSEISTSHITERSKRETMLTDCEKQHSRTRSSLPTLRRYATSQCTHSMSFCLG